MEREREEYPGVLIQCFVQSRGTGGTLLLSSFARTLLEIRAILLSRPSATLFFSLSTLSYTAPSLFISLCTPSYEPCPPQSFFPPIHILVDHYRFFHSLGSSTTYLFAFFHVYSSITWPQQYDSQSRPRRAFPVTILLTGLSSPLSISPLPLTLSPFHVAASPPGAEHVPLLRSLPVLIMLVPPMARPPPPLKPCLSPLLVLRHPSLARITKSSFKILRVSLYVLSIICLSLYNSYVTCSKGNDGYPPYQDRKTL